MYVLFSYNIWFIGSNDEFYGNYKLKLLRRLIPDGVRPSFVVEVTRVITEACASTKLADAPCTFTFSGKANSNSSVQFALLYMRYFTSASFGKFLTPDVPITNEFADRTQATISTACTAWLSSVGAGVGLPTSGFLLSSGSFPSFKLIFLRRCFLHQKYLKPYHWQALFIPYILAQHLA